jgi:hypothetical protein
MTHPLPLYIQNDDDWAFPGPVSLGSCNARAFPFLADPLQLAALCARYSVDGVTIVPWAPMVIVFACASDDITSLDPVYQTWGRLSERELGVFVPVVVTKGLEIFVALLCPYLFVDNGATLIPGREVYGLHKSLATFSPWPIAGGVPMPLTASSLTLPAQGDLATMNPVVTLSELVGATSPPVLPGDPRIVLTDLWTALVGGGTSVSLIVLKEFRSIQDGTSACYRQLVRCQLEPNVTALSLDLGEWQITLPPYFYPTPAASLGVASGTITLASVTASLDFSLSLGVVVAP